MRDIINELKDKWTDVLETSDDRAEKTLVEEFLDDLHELEKATRG